MARSSQIKNYFTFVKGLISEASPLTYPENSSIDESNFELFRDGSRKKRLGIDYEEGYSFIENGISHTDAIRDQNVSSYVWKGAAEDANNNLLVIQIGSEIVMHDLNQSSISAGYDSRYTIDLEAFKAPEALSAGDSKVSFATGKGYLFIVSKSINPIICKLIDTGLEVNSFHLNIRDFEGLQDGLSVTARPDVLSFEHAYNLLNQGWDIKVLTQKIGDNYNLEYYNAAWYCKNGLGPLRANYSVTGSELTYLSSVNIPIFNSSVNLSTMLPTTGYPSNADIWHYAKVEAASIPHHIGTFIGNRLAKHSFGNTEAPKGHFILNEFLKRRKTVTENSGGLYDTNEVRLEYNNNRPQSVGFYSGRLWTSLGSTLYFSQVLKDDARGFDRFYQKNDPTAEYENEILATDGGTIQIPDAGEILSIKTTSAGVLVLSSKGIWIISGEDGAFSATNFQTNFVSSIGIQDPHSVVTVESTIIYHNDSGIYTLEFDKVSGSPQVVNISETTIDSIFKTISPQARKNMQIVYDHMTKKVYWLYNDSSGYDGVSYKNRCTDILVLDTVLGAFYKLQIAEDTVNLLHHPYIYSAFILPELRIVQEDYDVMAGVDFVVNGVSDPVVYSGTGEAPVEISLTFLVFSIDDASSIARRTFAQLSNDRVLDWATHHERYGSITDRGIGYQAYLVTGYELQDDIMRYKQAPYIQCIFNKTERYWRDDTPSD